MAKYRKKPVVIEAFQMTEERRWNNVDWPEWLNEAWNKAVGDDGCLWCDAEPPHRNLHISTLEGVLDVSFGDFIIQGMEGELYPCKRTIFKKTYESAYTD